MDLCLCDGDLCLRGIWNVVGLGCLAFCGIIRVGLGNVFGLVFCCCVPKFGDGRWIEI